MPIRKAVIPAAGLGTRFLPVTKSVPKELLPILDRPMLQYVVAEAAEAGVEEVIVVSSPGKESIAGYFSPHPALEERLADSGDTRLLETVLGSLPARPRSPSSFKSGPWDWDTPCSRRRTQWATNRSWSYCPTTSSTIPLASWPKW